MIRSNFANQQLRQLDACRELIELLRKNDGSPLDFVYPGSTLRVLEQIIKFWDECIVGLLQDLPRFHAASRGGNEVGTVGAQIVQLRGGVVIATCQFQLAGILVAWSSAVLLRKEPHLVTMLQNQWVIVGSAIREGVSLESFRLNTDFSPLTVHQQWAEALVAMVTDGAHGADNQLDGMTALIERGARLADIAATNFARAYGAASDCTSGLRGLLDNVGVSRRHAILHNAKGTIVQIQALLHSSTGILEVLRVARILSRSAGDAYSHLALELEQFISASEVAAPDAS